MTVRRDRGSTESALVRGACVASSARGCARRAMCVRTRTMSVTFLTARRSMVRPLTVRGRWLAGDCVAAVIAVGARRRGRRRVIYWCMYTHDAHVACRQERESEHPSRSDGR